MKAKTRALAMPLDLTIRLRVRHLSVCLLLALALSVPALAETHKSKNGGRHDADISARLTSDLNKQERFKSVQASVEDGVVTLQGTVPLYVNKLDAEKRVKKQEHVTGVRNLITVAGASVPDSELREKLATKLRYDRIGFGIMFNNSPSRFTTAARPLAVRCAITRIVIPHSRSLPQLPASRT